jgi:CDP-glucose 4,6-dehydratase
MESVYADIRDLETLQSAIGKFRPDIVFHLAAQSLVRQSYVDPIDTYQINVMGTVHLLEAIRASRSCRVVINVTSDKCYENKERIWGYRESDAFGGHDPYSSSKGCAELVTAAYRSSFFKPVGIEPTGLATARAGNVIGGGDFAKDRLIPDLMSAVMKGRPLKVRNPGAIRPWQHVLEPLSGYLLLAEKLWDNPSQYAEGWNFGPAPEDTRPVRWIVETLNQYWGTEVPWELDAEPSPHEANLLILDSAKARMMLGWSPRWTLNQALSAVVRWYKAYEKGELVRDVMLQQIAAYEACIHQPIASKESLNEMSALRYAAESAAR